MSGDGSVTVLDVTSGPEVDTSELDVAGVTVERQRIVIADPVVAGNLAKTTIDGELWISGPHFIDLLTAVVVELRVHSTYLQQIANSRDEPDALRADPSFQP